MNELLENDFIGMASHELKTPLTALIQLLQQKWVKPEDSFIPQALVEANLQTQKMIGLINGYLNVSRLESGKLEILKYAFDITKLIAEELDESD